MPSINFCKYCGASIPSDNQFCTHCGAPNPDYVPETGRTVFLPKTIKELKEYCAERGMPLQRMRFFIGEDYREPKAFGIYQDGDRFVVYKNKANGSRAVRYDGPDEEYAVSELFAKLLEECHNRGIYPDGKPSGSEGIKGSLSQQKTGFPKQILIPIVILIFALIFSTIYSRNLHRNDGYYRYNGDIYYNYAASWYYNDGGSWLISDSSPVSNYEDYYAGTDYNSDWGGSDFKNSSAWAEIQERHSSSSSDYSDWDSSDTDWDSDW